MGFIQVEILTHGKKLSFEMESHGLYQLDFPKNTLKTLDKILSVLITDDRIILRTEDRDFRHGALQAPWLKDNRRMNNIDAYDRDGNHLWNIGDIVGDIKMSFTGCHLTSNAQLVDDGAINTETAYSANLLVCFSGGYRFIIDPIHQTVISKTSGKW
ncbi:MAG: hypothetical protein IJA86_01485 [Clostridia bacterium]|nr:hypothetical protein [Clostridia bacterium]